MRALLWGAAVIGVALECSSAPKYPACERDDQCAVSGKHDYCVTGRCVYCRTAGDCADRERCRRGACEVDPNAPAVVVLVRDAGEGDAEEGGEEEAGTDENDDQPREAPRFLPRGVRRLIHP